ncbi:MAG: polysaccharide biosynthesis tyrosine autokinase, partial [Planctomycetaceae bacterium]
GAGAGGGGGASNPLLSINPAKDRLDARLLEAQIQEANLVHHFGAQHPEVEKLRATINGIREAYAAEGLQPPPPTFDRLDRPAGGSGPARDSVDLAGVYRNYLNEQLRQLDLSDRSIERQLADAIAQAKKHAEYEVIDKQLSDELQRKQALWDSLVSKLSLVDFTKKQTGYRMTRVSDVLVELSMKRAIKIVGAFGLIGAVSLFGFGYFREWQDLSLRSVEEVRQYADAKIMGMVPHFAVDSQTPSRNQGLSTALCFFHRPGSREAEAYRSLRTTLFIATAEQTGRVIQISSPEPEDGKSTSAANLAIAVAQSGKRVLLIDADMRRPCVHELFGLDQDVGLSEALQREIEWINAVKPTAVDRLCVLTAGQVPENPAELLSISDLEGLLQAARTEFDYVFIDTPPLLAVSDPCIISPHVDGMLLVVRMQKNSRPAVVRAKDMLNAHGVEVYGIIANDVNAADATGPEFGAYAAYHSTASAQHVADTADAFVKPPVPAASGRTV